MAIHREQSDAILTYWLTPAEPARQYFTTVISELAARFDAPAFAPHVTVYVTKAEDENAAELIDCVMANRPPYRLSTRGIDHSDTFTKTVFVQFRSEPELTALSAAFRSASNWQHEYPLNPHLSLLYKDIDQETKRELAAAIALPFTEVIFDRVIAVVSPATISSREDVEAWRVVAERRLIG
jgi:2'-5' RNA ligase